MIILTGRRSAAQLERNLMRNLNIKEFHDAHYFLGAEIVRNREKRTLFLTQEAYTERLLEKWGMAQANKVSTPLSNELLRKSKSEEVVENEQYRSKLGGTQYLAIWTRPELAFAQSELATFVSCPGKKHHEALQRMFCYLRETKYFGLLFGGAVSGEEMSL